MKLYGSLASPYVARVVLFSRLKGFDLVPQMPEGGVKSAAYLATNPMGKMPLLESDGLAIPESEVICEYLEDLRPGQGGLAGDPAARARARLVSRIQDLYVGPHVTTLIRNLNPAKRDAAAVATATSALETGFGYLEHFVTANPFAAGPRPGLADCALLPSFVVLRRSVFPQAVSVGPLEDHAQARRGPARFERDVECLRLAGRQHQPLPVFADDLALRH